MALRSIDTDQVPDELRNLGPLLGRFSHQDDADELLARPDRDFQVVTGFGPTNAPTAGSLSVMLGVVEVQRVLSCPVTVVVSELGAWNSRNVPWSRLTAVRDQMTAFLRQLGFDESTGTLRSQLDHANLVRSGRLARFLARDDFLAHRESLLELYDVHGLLGTEVGMVVDSLYTVADILGPAEEDSDVLVLSGLEEAYLTQLARLVIDRQAAAGDLGPQWRATIGALYFTVLEGLAGYPKMSKSIPASAIHVGMGKEELTGRICSDDPAAQGPLLSAISLASGWDGARIADARESFARRHEAGSVWREVKRDYLQTFLAFAELWRRCG